MCQNLEFQRTIVSKILFSSVSILICLDCKCILYMTRSIEITNYNKIIEKLLLYVVQFCWPPWQWAEETSVEETVLNGCNWVIFNSLICLCVQSIWHNDVKSAAKIVEWRYIYTKHIVIVYLFFVHSLSILALWLYQYLKERLNIKSLRRVCIIILEARDCELRRYVTV